MLARESKLPLAKLGMVFASYGQCSLEQQFCILQWPEKRVTIGETLSFVPISLPPFPCKKAGFSPVDCWDFLLGFPLLPLSKPGKETTTAQPRKAWDAQVTAEGVLSNCEQLLAHTGGSCLLSSKKRTTPCFDQVFLGQIFIHQHKTEARERSISPASLQLLPFIFHVCFRLLEEPVSFLLLSQTFRDNT